MGPIDLLIILIAFISAYESYKRGFFRQLMLLISLIAGLSIGARLSNLIIKHVQSSLFRLALSVVVTAAVSLALIKIVEMATVRLKTKILISRYRWVDQYFGIFIGIIGGLIVSWFSASLIFTLGSVIQDNLVLNSKIVMYMDRNPILGVKGYTAFYWIDSNHSLNISQIISGAGDQPSYSLSSSDFPTPFYQAAEQDYGSVVRIFRNGCYGSGSYAEGSGYVAEKDVVVTAAHVVAGSGIVSVQTTNNNSYIGDVIKYDTKNDTAIIYVPNLPLTPLNLDKSQQNLGEAVAALGFPGTNPFEANTGYIKAYGGYADLQINAPTLEGGKSAKYYQTSAAAFPGDSGGPMINLKGEVIGDFTIYETNDSSYNSSDDNPSDISATYAVTLNSYYNELINSAKNPQRASTGDCPDD